MTFVTLSNLVLMLLCVVVVVQSLRMAKSIRDLRSSSLNDSVAQLDRAAGRAQVVLNEFKMLFATEGMAQNRMMASSEALRDELSVMIDMGNAVAERIMEAAAVQNAAKAAPAKKETPTRRRGAHKTRSHNGSGRRKDPATAVLAPPVTADTPVVGHA